MEYALISRQKQYVDSTLVQYVDSTLVQYVVSTLVQYVDSTLVQYVDSTLECNTRWNRQRVKVVRILGKLNKRFKLCVSACSNIY